VDIKSQLTNLDKMAKKRVSNPMRFLDGAKKNKAHICKMLGFFSRPDVRV
jgi:hypothetical protein